MVGYTFKQYDSRWGKKNYNGSSTMAAAGCGPTACACDIYAINTKITPWTTAQFMKSHGYAIRNNGTAWAGIPACLKHFGMKDVAEQSTMTKAFEKMAKGYLAVMLFRGGTKGGVTWTLGGHYLATTGYKAENGKHYLFMRDPGGRNHDGWFCYETQMRGLVAAIWTCTYDASQVDVPKPKTKGTYTGSYPSATISKNTGTKNNKTKWQTFLAWWSEDDTFSIDGIFGNITKSRTISFQKKYGLKQDGIVGPITIAKAKEVGAAEIH